MRRGVRREGEYRFMNTMAGYRPELALRTMEALSPVGLHEAVFAVGEGENVLSAWERRIDNRFPGLRRPCRPYLEDVAGFWANIRGRGRNGSRNFTPMTIIR